MGMWRHYVHDVRQFIGSIFLPLFLQSLRLAGFPPFWHRKQMVMLRSIMEGKYKFSSPEWDDISDGAKDLIRQLLCLDPTKRLSAVEALNHPWMTISLVRKKG